MVEMVSTVQLSFSAIMGDALYQITAPHFCAGITVAQDGAVTSAAPIVGWMSNKPLAYVRRYCAGKGWQLERVPRADRG